MATAQLGSEPEVSDDEFERLRALVYRHSGISLGPDKREMLYRRLQRRLQTLGIRTVADYCQRLDSGDLAERHAFINAVTTNTTAFFRETQHLDYLREQLIPQLQRQRGGLESFRVWAAGCGTGEDAYAIAMALHQQLGEAQPMDIRVLGSDIDKEMLATATRAVYPLDHIVDVPRESKRAYFWRGVGEQAQWVKLRDSIRRLVDFRRVNLALPLEMPETFDAVFCNNTASYFDSATQSRIYTALSQRLTPGGVLILGQAEPLPNLAGQFACLAPRVYRPLNP